MRVTTEIILDWDGNIIEHEWFDYDGPVALACGPSQQQKDLATAQINAYNTETADANAQMAQAQQVQTELQSQWLPIFQAGPYQNFFQQNPAEWNGIMSNITTTEGQATSNALKATQGNINAEGGGNEFTPQGANQALIANINTQGAQATAGAQQNATQAGYTEGASMFQQAGAALAGVPSVASPVTGFETASTGAGSSAEGTQNQIAQESMAPFQSLTSLAGAGLGAASTLGAAQIANS
jgi:hypothetical protein